MSRIDIAYQYIRHFLRSKRWNAFHSPFLFDLFTYSCDSKDNSLLFKEIEKQRKKFKQSSEFITRKDFGAGSMMTKEKKEQKIASIAHQALSHPFQCRFLAHLAQYSNAKTILEFGTSLGISAAYFASANPQAQIITIEGDPELASRAKKLFHELGFINITTICSTFEEFISDDLKSMTSIEIVFLDGNHRSDALLSYYDALLPYLHSGSILIVDDIYWSKDMQLGWKKLQNRPDVTQSVDCFHFGLLFFRPDFLDKERHSIYLPI